MKNEKGISLKKLIIAIILIIAFIFFIVKMCEPQDGIGTVKEEQEKYNKVLQEKEKADKEYYDSLENLVKSKENLERIEKGY